MVSATSIHDLRTPALLIERSRLEENLREMAALCAGAGVRLTPHVKTHKCLELARLQGRSLCAAKPSEAEVFSELDLDDLTVAYPIHAMGAQGLRAVAERSSARVATVADSEAGLAGLVAAWRGAARPLRVFVKIDCGLRRVGIPVEDVDRVAALAERIVGAPGVELAGLLTHAGQAYAARTGSELAEIGRHEGQSLVALAEALRARGLPVAEVSVGSTPTARHAVQVPGVTELRPGVYVFNDANQVALGVVPVERCALTVWTTVVSRPAPERAVVDAGAKTFSSDRGAHGVDRPDYGIVLDADARLARLSEEHGWLAVAPDEQLNVGDRLRVVPAHCCAVANLGEAFWVVEGERVVDRWPIAARGRVC